MDTDEKLDELMNICERMDKCLMDIYERIDELDARVSKLEKKAREVDFRLLRGF